IGPAWPSSRRVSAARPPAWPAPTITIAGLRIGPPVASSRAVRWRGFRVARPPDRPPSSRDRAAVAAIRTTLRFPDGLAPRPLARPVLRQPGRPGLSVDVDQDPAVLDPDRVGAEVDT